MFAIYNTQHFIKCDNISITAGSDFEDRVIPVIIPAGQTRFLVDVSIINDNLVEQSQEQFSIMLQLDSDEDEGVIIAGAGVGTVNIIDDDSKSSIEH